MLIEANASELGFSIAIKNQRSRITNHLLSSPFAADPIVPNAVGLEHFHAIGVAHGLLNLIVGKTRADLFGQIRQFNAQRGGLGHVLLQLGEVYLVVGVGDGVIILEVVRFFLIGDESGHALQHEIEVIGAPFHVELQCL